MLIKTQIFNKKITQKRIVQGIYAKKDMERIYDK